MKKLLLSSELSLHAYPKNDILEYIRQGLLFHKSIGLDAADFPMRYITLMGDSWQDGISKTVQMSQDIGMPIKQCHLPFISQTAGSPDAIASFNADMYRAINAAKLLGVSYAVVHPNSTTIPLEGYDRKAEYDNIISFLSPFIEYANKVGLNIVIENMRIVHKDVPSHRCCCVPEELCDIADLLGIGVCWDTGHAHITGLKQSDAIKYVGSRLKMLHINDNFAGDDIHIAPFIGTVDWSDVMKGLSAIDYNGLLNYEVSVSRMPASARKAFGDYLYTAAKELLSLM